MECVRTTSSIFKRIASNLSLSNSILPFRTPSTVPFSHSPVLRSTQSHLAGFAPSGCQRGAPEAGVDGAGELSPEPDLESSSRSLAGADGPSVTTARAEGTGPRPRTKVPTRRSRMRTERGRFFMLRRILARSNVSGKGLRRGTSHARSTWGGGDGENSSDSDCGPSPGPDRGSGSAGPTRCS